MNQFLQTKEEIEAWLKKSNIHNYTLYPTPQNIKDKIDHEAIDSRGQVNWLVDVQTNVILTDSSLTQFPVHFNEVEGAFICTDSQLSSLKGAPRLVHGAVHFDNNHLTSLEYGPQYVQGFFSCSRNQLTSLKGAPQQVLGDFFCDSNQIISLEYCPSKVAGEFICRNNPFLGDIQDITDFEQIKLRHLERQRIVQEKQHFNNSINSTFLATRETQKFKI